MNEEQDNALVPSSNANTESQLPSETTMNNSSNSNSTKSRFRAARSPPLPAAIGAFAMSPTRHTTSSIGSDSDSMLSGERNLQNEDEFSSNPYEENPLNDTNQLESGTLIDIAGEESITPCIVNAEVVGDEATLDPNERRRIVEETIESFTNQAVTAEVVNVDGDKSSRKYRAVILILMFIVIVFVVVLVAVLKSRGSEATSAPTMSPTPYVDPSVFYTIEELYEAVDAYRMSSWNETNQSSFESSEVAMRYGYPIASWNVSLITNFSRVFDPKRLAPDIDWEFNEDLGNWDVSNAESMMGMFMNAIEFRGLGLENWNVGKVWDFSYMFMNSGFNGTLSGWNTSNAEILDSMFATTKAFNDDLSMWDVSRVHSMNGMFYDAAMFEGVGLEYWDVRTVRDFSFLFSNAFMFNGSLSGWNTSNVEIMDRMFADAVIFNDDLSLWDVSKVTSMISMFSFASAFTGDGIGNWDVSKVTSIDNMFSGAVVFDGDVSQWDVSRLSTLSATVSIFGFVFLADIDFS
jgi:surface protein